MLILYIEEQFFYKGNTMQNVNALLKLMDLVQSEINKSQDESYTEMLEAWMESMERYDIPNTKSLTN